MNFKKQVAHQPRSCCQKLCAFPRRVVDYVANALSPSQGLLTFTPIQLQENATPREKMDALLKAGRNHYLEIPLEDALKYISKNLTGKDIREECSFEYFGGRLYCCTEVSQSNSSDKATQHSVISHSAGSALTLRDIREVTTFLQESGQPLDIITIHTHPRGVLPTKEEFVTVLENTLPKYLFTSLTPADKNRSYNENLAQNELNLANPSSSDLEAQWHLARACQKNDLATPVHVIVSVDGPKAVKVTTPVPSDWNLAKKHHAYHNAVAGILEADLPLATKERELEGLNRQFFSLEDFPPKAKGKKTPAA